MEPSDGNKRGVEAQQVGEQPKRLAGLVRHDAAMLCMQWVERKRAFATREKSGHDFFCHIGSGFFTEQVLDDSE